MIISHMLGGIGNQMFQYAAGKSLSLKTNQVHWLDLNDFNGYQLHNGFELDRVFNIEDIKSSPTVAKELLSWRANSFAKKILLRSQFARLRGQSFIVEPHFNYWPEFFELKRNCYLYGYWQSELYFKNIESTIRQDFSFKQPLNEVNQQIAIDIAKIESVSLHVRRGDYVNDPKTTATHGTCSISYYVNAINYIANQIEQPVFYIFSDDIDWVKKNIQITFPCNYISHNQGAESYNDMHLMSLCKHHIIANSSFSWWGAWLNPSPNKLVIAPKNWFATETNTEDLLPKNWITL